MREMITVQIADQGGVNTVKRIREHIWTKRSKIQKHGGLLPPLLQSERASAGGVPHFIGRSRLRARLCCRRVLHVMPCD